MVDGPLTFGYDALTPQQRKNLEAQTRQTDPGRAALIAFNAYHPVHLNALPIENGSVVAEANSEDGHRMRLYSNNPFTEVGPNGIGPAVCPDGTAMAIVDANPPTYVTNGCWAPTRAGKIVIIWAVIDDRWGPSYKIKQYDPASFVMNADLALDLRRLAETYRK